MEEPIILTPYLEGRTTEELRALGACFELSFPEFYDRNRIIDELLEYAPCLRFYQQDEIPVIPEFKEKIEQPNTQLELPDPTLLPKQYYTTFVDVLVHDPFWVFVIWEISLQDINQYEKKNGFTGYSLRVRHKDSCNEDKNYIHIVQIGKQNSSRDMVRYINFLPESGGVSYIIELCAENNNTHSVIAVSLPFSLPNNMPAFGSAEESDLLTPILILSGIEELNILRGNI